MGIDSTHHSVVLSPPDEGRGIKPSELLLIAVASCSAVDVVEILSKKRMPLSALEISSSGEQDAEAPWTFRKIHLHYCLSGKNLTEKAVGRPSSFLKRSTARSLLQYELLLRSSLTLR